MNTLQKITRKAKQIRKKGEPWTHAIKRASKLVPSLSPSKKSGRKVGAKKKRPDNHQTGGSNKEIDKRIRAKSPGKRTIKSGKKTHSYYERRQNRSDKPGQLTGKKGIAFSTYRYNVLARITSTMRLLNEAESKKIHLEKRLKDTPRTDRSEKLRLRGAIQDQRNYIRTLKRDISGFKTLLK